MLHRASLVTVLAALAWLAACAGSSRSSSSGSSPEQGAFVLDVEADPNGLWWDAASSRLLLADNVSFRGLTRVAPGGPHGRWCRCWMCARVSGVPLGAMNPR